MPSGCIKHVTECKEQTWDEALAVLADRIFITYNNSFAPPLVKISTPYTIKHIAGEYFLLIKKGNETEIGCTAENLAEFLRRMFLFFGEDVSWSYITASDAVICALNEKFGTQTLRVKKVKCDSCFGEYFVCTETINDESVDGYYSFDENGGLKRLAILS